MIVVHAAQSLTLDRPAPARRRSSMVIVVILLFALAIGAAVAGVYFALREPDTGSAPSAFRHKLVKINFNALPTREDAAIVDETTVSDTAMLQRMSPEEAQAYNARIAAISGPIQPARPLTVPLGDRVNFLRSLDCMTAAVYYEAANEPLDGQRAVAQVILNRVRHVAYPHSVCGVVFQGSERRTGCQFSFTCDGSMARIPSRQGWLRARGVAGAALSGLVYAPVGLSTHYHADYVVPYWASSLTKVKTLGRHIFYRWPGLWGKLAAFVSPYAGNEQPFPANRGVDTAAAGEEGLIGADGLPLLIPSALTPAVLPAERPVLRGGAPVPVPDAALAAAGNALGAAPAPARAYLSSRVASTPASATPASPPTPAAAPAPRSVTGGVLRASTQPLPPVQMPPTPPAGARSAGAGK